uniref:Uncharacterized protein n=1 Tax=Glossina pallidipes TaxID=7398 RepID=A0A1B0AG99_GLOPL
MQPIVVGQATIVSLGDYIWELIQTQRDELQLFQVFKRTRDVGRSLMCDKHIVDMRLWLTCVPTVVFGPSRDEVYVYALSYNKGIFFDIKSPCPPNRSGQSKSAYQFKYKQKQKTTTASHKVESTSASNLIPSSRQQNSSEFLLRDIIFHLLSSYIKDISLMYMLIEKKQRYSIPYKDENLEIN